MRENGAAALVGIIAERPFRDWNYGVLSNLVLTLFEVSEKESNIILRASVGYCLYKILSIYPGGHVFESHHADPISTDKMKAGLEKTGYAKGTGCSAYFISLAERLEQWVKESMDEEKP